MRLFLGRLGLSVLRVSVLLGRHSQLVTDFEAFGKQLADATLAFGNVTVNNKFAVYSHVVEGV